MRVAVTGGAGFIGSHVVEALLAAGDEVIVIDDFSSPAVSVEWFDSLPSLPQVHDFSILDPKLPEVFAGCDCVVHLAAMSRSAPSQEERERCLNVNVIGTANVLQACELSATPRLIYAASSTCYGRGAGLPEAGERRPIELLNYYGWSKYAAEQLLLMGGNKGPKVLSLRLFNVYGDREPTDGAYALVIGTFRALADAGKPLTVHGDGQQSRDFVHVSDVASAFLLASRSTLFGYALDIGSGVSTSILELACMFSRNVVFAKRRENDAEITIADAKSTERALGWVARVSLGTGLAGGSLEPQAKLESLRNDQA